MKEWRELCERFRLRYLVLFGSRVKGRVDVFSDWDLAVKFGRKPSIKEYLELMSAAMEVVGSDKLDLVVLDDAPPPLLFEALWGGKPLCIQDVDEYHWDRVRALALYSEYKTMFRPLLLKWVRKHGD